jgi:2'-5' RNA ligase
MPAHITLLYPFFPPRELSKGLLENLRSFFSHQQGFSFFLSGLCGFPEVIYLVPEPPSPFDSLRSALSARFPGKPPYGGVYEDPVPHLTVAQTPPARSLEVISQTLMASVVPELPFKCRASEASLMVKRAGRWSLRSQLQLA